MRIVVFLNLNSMVLTFSLSQIREILDCFPVALGEDSGKLRVSGICTDSREIESGQLFVALKGENFDGHRFVSQAAERGAVGAVTERVCSDLALPQFVVGDALDAYQRLAQAWRRSLPAKIIGITGSVGKTTTKEFVAAVLGHFGQVHKTQANYNNEIGVPKTLLQMTAEQDYGVVEMAMRGRGEIALLAQIAEPNIGLITNVGAAHIERLGSEEAIAEAKCELLAELPKDSVAILNHDNRRLMETASRFWSGKTLTYGLEGGDFRGEWLGNQALKIGELIFPVPLPGRHQASNYLAALACAEVLGLDWRRFTAGLTVELPGGRAKQIALAPDILLLDETYNAGVESMLAALELLAQTPGRRRIAVLGAMKELGDWAPELHERVGAKVKELAIDALFLLAADPAADYIAQGAAGVPAERFEAREALVEGLRKTLQPGDRILFKASNSVGLGQVVAALVGAS